MKLPALSVTAILLGLAAGFTTRTLGPQSPSAPPQLISRSGNSQTAPSLAQPIPLQNSPPALQDLSPGARYKAELYLFLPQATPGELTAHWLTILEDKNTTDESLIDFAFLWVRRDPENALTHLAQSKSQNLYWWTLARHDPQKALAQVDPQDISRYSEVIHAIGTIDPDFAITLVNKGHARVHITALGGIIAGLFTRDPTEALDFAYQHRSRYNYHLGEHLTKWASQDPHQAFAWALAHPEIQSDDFSSLAPILLEQDPEFFAQEFAKLPTGKAKAKFLGAQAAHLAQSDPDAALQFAEQQSPHLKQEILKQVGDSLVYESPDLALQILSNLINLGSSSKPGFQLTSPNNTTPIPPAPTWDSEWVKTLVKDHPETVMKFTTVAAAQPGSNPTDSIQAIQTWLDLDAPSARDWVITQSPSKGRDYLTRQTTRHLADHDLSNYPSHLTLPNQIHDPEIRQETLNSLFNSWYFHDETGLKDFLRQNTLTPEQQKAYDQRGYN